MGSIQRKIREFFSDRKQAEEAEKEKEMIGQIIEDLKRVFNIEEVRMDPLDRSEYVQ